MPNPRGPGELDCRSRVYESYVSGRQEDSPEDIGWVEQRGPYLKRIIRRHFPASRSAAILDLGCGHGALLYYAQICGYTNLTGIDRSSEQVALARRLGIAGIRQGDLLKELSSQPSESFDMVVAFDVIEHFRRDELLLLVDQIQRVLRTGGSWLIHIPNGASVFAGSVRYGDLTHEMAFSESSIAQLLKASGFREISCYEDSPVPHGVKSAIRWVLWKGFRSFLSFWYAVETGGPLRICSLNFLTVARKA